nr:hypothetical protein [Dictyobacter formicarum]
MRKSLLCDFKERVANAIPIANIDLCVRQTVHRKVLADLPEVKVMAAKLLFPVVVGIQLVNKDCAVYAAMPVGVSLRISTNIQVSHHSATLYRLFPDRRAYRLSTPRDIAWQTNIDRESLWHTILLPVHHASIEHAIHGLE